MKGKPYTAARCRIACGRLSRVFHVKRVLRVPLLAAAKHETVQGIR